MEKLGKEEQEIEKKGMEGRNKEINKHGNVWCKELMGAGEFSSWSGRYCTEVNWS